MATVQRLNLPQRAGSAKGYFAMPKAWTSQGGSSEMSEWMNYPLDTKMPLIPGLEKALVLYTTNLGERLHARRDDYDFDLTDPCGHQMSTEYNLLHDPHLKPFFSSPYVKHRLIKNGFITEDGKVLCTLKEFNQYRQYLRKISLDHYRHERRRQLESSVLARERAEQKKKEEQAQSKSLQIIKERRDKAKETRQKLKEEEEAAKRRYMAMMKKDAMKRNVLQMEKTLNQDEHRKQKEKEWENQRFKFQLKQDKDRRRRKKDLELWKAEEKERQRRLEERRRQEQKEKEAKAMEHFVEHARLRAMQREEMLRVEEEERVRRQENIRAREAAIQAQRQKQYELFLKRKQRQQERREHTQKTLLQMWRDKTKAGQGEGTEVGTGGRAGLFSRFMGVTESAEPAKAEAEKKGMGLNLGRLVDRAIDQTMEDFETGPPPSQEGPLAEQTETESLVREPPAADKQEKPATRKTVKIKTGIKGLKRSFKQKMAKDFARLQSEFPGAKLIDMDEMARQQEEKTRQAEMLRIQLQTDFPGADVSLWEEEEEEEDDEMVKEVELQQALSLSQTTLLHMRAAEIVRAVMETVSKVIIPRMVSEDKFRIISSQTDSDTDIAKQTAREFVPWVIKGVQRELRGSGTREPSMSDTRVLSKVASDMVVSALDKLQTDVSTHRVSRAASQLVSSVIDGVKKGLSSEDMEVRKSTSDSSLLSKTARGIATDVIDGVTKELTGQRADLSAMFPTKSSSDTYLLSRTASRVVSSVASAAKKPSKVQLAVSESGSVRQMATQITSWVIDRVRQDMADGSSEASAESFDDSCLERELLRTMRADSTPVEEPYSRPLSPEPSSDAEISRAGSKQSTVSKMQKTSTSKITSRRVSKESIRVSARASSSLGAVRSTSSSSHKVRLLAPTSRTSLKTSPVTSKVQPSPQTSKTTATPTRKLSRTSRESVTSLSKKPKSDSAVQKTSKERTSTSLSGRTMSPDAVSTDKPAKAAPSKEEKNSAKKLASTTQASLEHKEPVKTTSLPPEQTTFKASPKSSASLDKQPSTKSQKGKGFGKTSSESNGSARRPSISAPRLNARRSSSKNVQETTSSRSKSSGGVVVRSGPSLPGADVNETREGEESTDSDNRVVKTAPSTPVPEDDSQLAVDAAMPSSLSEGSVKAKTSRSVNKVDSTQSAWSATPSRKTSSQSSSLTKSRDKQSTLMSPSGTKVSPRKSRSKTTSQTGIVTSQLGSSSRTPSVDKPSSRSSTKASSSKSTSEVTAKTSSRSSGSGRLQRTRSGGVKSTATPTAQTKSELGVRLKASRSGGGSKASSTQAGKPSSTQDASKRSSDTLSKIKSSTSNVKTSQSKSKESIKDKTGTSVESEAPKFEEMEGVLDEDLHLDEDEERDFGGDSEDPPAEDMQLLGEGEEMSDVSDVEDEQVVTETENVVIKKRRESLVGALTEEEPKATSGSKASMKSYRRHSIAGSCATMEADRSDRSEFAPLAPTLQGRAVELDDDLEENLSAISVKASFQDRMQDEITPRNSFRCLQRPELSSTQGLEREESLRSLITKRRMSMPSGATLASFRAQNSSEDVVQVNTMFDVGEFSRGVRRYSEVPKSVATHQPEVDSSTSLEKILESKENKT
ncbi:uncharacterized protein LOC144863447 isoform X2 [Branchiostoma floridae x Branchiostoma japonicum]